MEDIYYALNPWWEGKDFDCGIPREEYLNKFNAGFDRRQIEIILGGRRVGKTTFVKQLVKQCLKKNLPARNILYLAIDHPRFLGVSLTEHLTFFRKLFMHGRNEKLFLFLDEIQESPNWEGELKAIYDLENVKIISSGSTLSLIQSQGGKLTGRQIVTTIYPLSFKEFLSFKKESLSLAESYKYENLVEDYLNTGGYPENVLNPSDEYLCSLLEDILARDLIRVFRPKKSDIFKDLLRLMASSVGSRISFNKLSNILGVSVDTVKEYVAHLQTAFLVKSMEKWSSSHKERIYTAKKIYFLDTGFQSLLTGRLNLGAKAENTVFLHFLRKGKYCGYFAESEKEIDFVGGTYEYPAGTEVKYMSEFEWQDKRFAGVRLFLRRFPSTKEVTIISKNVERELEESGIKIIVIPLWKFLLRE
ncbi:hypothetical protein AUJ66_06375 [Candidatus Desantisbacteria bacterium CG1_02_38_46]|uniref:AAA+ ATPase domain-containing protein n=3 Tax=unclassified Candidatus Desantisiibacteriota TaxID=3106372 RepID=A0A2H9PCR7_9BACT|nr:MAG: hypothetical protein AUJ66_06375 [Candidatus Desantisbacteria bacterium CG1_02_38_46]PIU52220.1 MAG: hypothetical protein COS91_00370 [Candidatus Desantisbacteria bacterium CG07_land_8_20_14_0_80_39_15]PIZ17123.1 MAG: hypothetical protein COY51_01060 [Candidatus Desantisbacteria bacterium CG_4_10_14_0_8_um_filter_39_17]